MDQLRYLGRLLDFEVDGYDNFLWLQTYLNNYDVEAAEPWYDTYGRLKRLSPQCEDLLLHCMWEGVERSCQELFQFRVTQEGFCCTFNYIRSDTVYHNENAEPLRNHLHGAEHGLQLILNASDEDYYYPMLNHYGVSVLITKPHDYPDMGSGSLEQRFIKPDVETMIELFPRTLESTESVRWFSPEQRQCFFRDEPDGYNGFYSQSDCLVNCRVRSFVDLCDCIPFFIPRSTANPLLSNRTQTCNLEHVQCLNKYQSEKNIQHICMPSIGADASPRHDPHPNHIFIPVKLSTYYPTNGNITGLEKELQDSMDCGQCLPLCNHVAYNVGTVSLTLYPEELAALARDKLGRNDTPALSVVKIYYARRKSALYVQDVVSEWFNMLSECVCAGVAVITVI